MLHASITWTVHLVNAKAAHPDRGNSEPAADLTIDPGPRMLTGPNQRQAFDTGTIRFAGAPVTTVPLGEIRSSPESHLLVLGSAGRSGSPVGTALEACVGGPLGPGIETGGRPEDAQPIADPANYAEPHRLDHAPRNVSR